jgi:ketosteroid isomerase-like protein
MGSTALEVVREVCEAIEANDWGRGTETFDPEIVQYGTRGGIDQDRVIRGREAVLDYWREIQQAWAGLDIEVEQLIDAGDNIVAFLRETARSRHSDLDVHIDTAMVFRVRNGRVVEVRGYMDREEALRAAGLRAAGEQPVD